MIGKGLNKIGNKSFGKCKKLKSIVIKSKVLKSAGQQAFWGTNKKAVIKVPSQKRKLYGKILKKAGLSNSIIIR